jgi:sugar lactone lactonase YvrE
MGCATPPPTREIIMYPPPPAEPRLQFLTSYSDSRDVERPPNRFLRYLTGVTAPRVPIVKPYGVAVSKGKLFVVDTVLNAVAVLDLQDRTFEHFAPAGPGRFGKPINLAVDTDGTRYVTDTGRGQVLIYSEAGRYLGALGAEGELQPVGLDVTPDRMYVTDLKGHNVRVYDKRSRELLLSIPRAGCDDSEMLFSPTNLAVDAPRRRLYVSDMGAFRVQVYDLDGEHLGSIGRHGDRPGEFARPKGVAVDDAGRIFVVDAALQTVQIFDDAFRLLMFFGEPGSGPVALNLPAQVVVDREHVDMFREYAAPDFEVDALVIVTSQYGNRKVTVYGFGRER